MPEKYARKIRQKNITGADIWIWSLPSRLLPFRARARCAGREFICALGRAGVKSEQEKREGDGATPAGSFPLRRVLFRAARLPRPGPPGVAQEIILPARSWCEDPTDPNYNRLHRNPSGGLWRADGMFDLIIVPGHNDNPPHPGKGSGIFLHAARPGFAPTEGCAGFARESLRWIARQLGPGSVIHIARPGGRARFF